MSDTSERFDRRPLLTELVKDALRREEALKAAKERRSRCNWKSPRTSVYLGLAHILVGIVLLIFDVATNATSGVSFGISSALCFIICAILSFIAARRLDRPAQWLIIIFAALSAAMCLGLIVDSTLIVNKECFPVKTVRCTAGGAAIHSVLMFIAFVELVLCMLSIFASYRNMKATAKRAQNMLYASLMSGRFSRLPSPLKPEQLSITTVEESVTRPSSLQTA